MYLRSPIIPLAKYMSGPLTADGWQRVRVPINALQTTKWALGDVETLAWLNGSVGCDFAFPGSYGR